VASAGSNQTPTVSTTTAVYFTPSTGSIYAGGNVTAYSDERLKKDWEQMPSDFVDRLANVLAGSFTRIDSGLRQVGVGAQSLQPLMPDAVPLGNDEVLTVAYGQAALVACVELAKRVVQLETKLKDKE
jgi:hypothetical protein